MTYDRDLEFDTDRPVSATLPWAVTTERHRDGVRTLRYNGAVAGHYQRAMTPDGGRGWRGVTHTGQLVHTRSELAVRAALLGRLA